MENPEDDGLHTAKDRNCSESATLVVASHEHIRQHDVSIEMVRKAADWFADRAERLLASLNVPELSDAQAIINHTSLK